MKISVVRQFVIVDGGRVKKIARVPLRGSEGAAGWDLFAYERYLLGPVPLLVRTGISLSVPRGYDAQIRPRSGLSAKGVHVALGTLDSDYRGEVFVTMWSLLTTAHQVEEGDRIAQLVVVKHEELEFVEVDELPPTKRGNAGHGSTGR